uniref:TEA domain-containing protein n=1 Tax=Anopheles quadriannulatus TaxID=34691 RepID=A0A182XEG6_ANOQN
RNELIARYIKLRTGKTRTRKQVSSHIQVLARRKLREFQAKMKVNHPLMGVKEKVFPTNMTGMSSAQIVTMAAAKGRLPLANPSYHHHHHHHHQQQQHHLPYHHHHPSAAGQFWQPGLQPSTSQDVKPFAQPGYPMKTATAVSEGALQPAHPWEGRAIATHKFRLVEYSAYLELRAEETYHKHLFVHIADTPANPLLESVEVKEIYDKFPQKSGGLKELYEKGPSNAFFLVKFWADLNTNIANDAGAFYGVSSHYESNDNMVITCSTKVCSFGKQVVEKVETEYSRIENGRYVYRISRSPMCDYMINFINKLKHLPEKYMMNSVLENFTILQVISNKDTDETLLCVAFVFEVSTSEHDHTSDSILLSNPNLLAAGDYPSHNNNSSDGGSSDRPATTNSTNQDPGHLQQTGAAEAAVPPPAPPPPIVDLPSCLVEQQTAAALLPQSTTPHQPATNREPPALGVVRTEPTTPTASPEELVRCTGDQQQQQRQPVKQEYLGLDPPDYGQLLEVDAKRASQQLLLLQHRPALHQLLRD